MGCPRWLLAPILTPVILFTAACLPEPTPAMDEATVLSNNTSVRMDATTSARTLFTLDAGTRVSILEKRDTWYLIRDPDLLEGWMDESTVIRDGTREAMAEALVAATDRPVQTTARAIDAVNLRLAPGRDTDVIRRLRRGAELEVLDRRATPNADSGGTDVWFQVRPSAEEIGWAFGQLIELDVPEVLRDYTENRIYAAVFPLEQVEDPDVGLRTWYLVAERRPETDPEVAFDGIRVFIWNLTEHAYATTLRLRNLRGAYPIEVTRSDGAPGFRIPVENADGTTSVREFVMRGTIPREVR